MVDTKILILGAIEKKLAEQPRAMAAILDFCGFDGDQVVGKIGNHDFSYQ